MSGSGSCAGAPFSHGIKIGDGQYGIFSVVDYRNPGDDDPEGKLCVHVGLRKGNSMVMGYDTCNPHLYVPKNRNESCLLAYG